jgi:hypothetical protein
MSGDRPGGRTQDGRIRHGSVGTDLEADVITDLPCDTRRFLYIYMDPCETTEATTTSPPLSGRSSCMVAPLGTSSDATVT